MGRYNGGEKRPTISIAGKPWLNGAVWECFPRNKKLPRSGLSEGRQVQHSRQNTLSKRAVNSKDGRQEHKNTQCRGQHDGDDVTGYDTSGCLGVLACM